MFEKPHVANENMASATLKAAIYLGQESSQMSKFFDRDQDGKGEFTFIAYLSGTKPPAGHAEYELNDGEISFITGRLAKAKSNNQPRSDGKYNYKIYLPDGKNGAYDQQAYASATDKTTGIDDREKHYICYAWPIEAKNGTKIFAITEKGTLIEKNGTTEPKWNDAFTTKTGTASEVFGSDWADGWEMSK